MNSLVALLIVLSTGGHWFGGGSANVTLRWPVESEVPATAIVRWELVLGEITLERGERANASFAKPVEIEVRLPNVRARTTARFRYRVVAEDRDVAGGEVPVVLYPARLTEGLSDRLGKSRVVLVDRGTALERVQQGAGVAVQRVETLAKLAWDQPDIVVIAPGEFAAAGRDGGPSIESMAAAGASVIVLRQVDLHRGGGYPLTLRSPAIAPKWRIDHPILATFDEQTLTSWLAEDKVVGLQLPANEAALEIGFWPGDADVRPTGPLDAVVVSKSIGRGRMIHCQIPFGDPNVDPRAQQLLVNLLDYAATRPQPTPPPSERPEETKPVPSRPKNILP